MNQFLSVICVFFFFVFSQSLKADIALSEVILDFKETNMIRKDIVVENVGNDKKFVAVEPAIISNPGEDPVNRVPFKNPKSANLIVTPNKMILNPKQKRNIRFIVKSKPKDKDEVYRVRVVPKLGKVTMKGQQNESEKTTGVKVVVGYDVLVINRPSAPKIDYHIERNGKTLTITNKANTNFLVRSIKQCDNFESENNCEKINGPRIHAQKTKKITLKRDLPVEISLKFFNNNKIVRY